MRVIDERLRDFLIAYEGTLLQAEDERFSISVKYREGSLPLFSGVELFVFDKSKVSNFQNLSELENAMELYFFRFFLPAPYLVAEAVSEATKLEIEGIIARLQEDLKNELYTFYGRGKALVIAAGKNLSLSRRGVYLYSEVRPDRELPEPLPVVEITEKGIELHEENLKLEP